MDLTPEKQRRLRKLIVFMESLPAKAEEHFNMGAFLEHHGNDHEHSAPKRPADILRSCGTTACALGWAATMPYFQKLGLRFNKHGELIGKNVIVNAANHKWLQLFGGWNEDQTPKQWAKRARGLLAEWS